MYVSTAPHLLSELVYFSRLIPEIPLPNYSTLLYSAFLDLLNYTVDIVLYCVLHINGLAMSLYKLKSFVA